VLWLCVVVRAAGEDQSVASRPGAGSSSEARGQALDRPCLARKVGVLSPWQGLTLDCCVVVSLKAYCDDVPECSTR
jgi:hypothetical protein